MKAKSTVNKKEKHGKSSFFGIVLVTAVTATVVCVGIYAYTTLTKPSASISAPPAEGPETTLLTIHVGGQAYDYTLHDLTALASVSGQGGCLTDAGTVTGPDTYTGVPMSVLLSALPALPENYTLHAIASDGHTHEYSLDTVQGHVLVYNRAGEEIGPGTLTMIVAYRENGVPLDGTTNGTLRIAFVYSSPVITTAGLWLSSLSELVIT